LVFVTLVMGVVELGRGIMVSHALTQAARRGCRAAVPAGKTNADITPAVSEALTAARLQGAAVTVQVNGAAADAATARTNDRITVSVRVPVASVSWLPGTNFLAGTLRGQYTLRRE
jgi:Flp pilus assembly protein TadG